MTSSTASCGAARYPSKATAGGLPAAEQPATPDAVPREADDLRPAPALPGRASILRAALVFLLPVLVWAAWLAGNYRGLVTAEGLHLAQVSRNVAEGRGWITDVITPLGLRDKPALENHPELWHPPLFIMWEATLFRLLGPHGKVAAAASGFWWLALAWVSFGFTRSMANTAIAFLALLSLLLNPVLLDLSVAGTGHTMTATLLVALFWQMAHAARRRGPAGADAAPAATIPAGDIVRSGLLVSALCLTDYDLVLPSLAVWLLVWLAVDPWATVAERIRHRGEFKLPLLQAWAWITRHPMPRVAALFLGVVIVATAPWWIRNARVTGDPLYSLHRYSMLTGTDTYPGQSVFRYFSDATPDPVAFAVTHTREMLAKIVTGLDQGAAVLVKDVNPLIFAAFCAMLVMPAGGRPVRLLARVAAVVMLLHLGAVASHEQDRAGLAVLIPLAVCLGLAGCFAWVSEVYPAPTPERDASIEGRRIALPAAPVLVVAFAVLAASALGMLACRIGRPAPGRLEVSPNIGQLVGQMPPGGAVLSTCPWTLAWQGRVSAVWMPEDRSSLTSMKSTFGFRLPWLYFTKQRAMPVSNDQASAAWFDWIRSRVNGRTAEKSLSLIPREYVFPLGDRP